MSAVATSVLASKGEETRQTILDAAIVRFGRDGYRRTSVAAIARDASVGGTVPYTYFADKEALFLAAIDEDAAGVVDEGLAVAFETPDRTAWRDTLLVTLVGALADHPLAERILAGLEPEVTVRVLELPAIADLRKTCTERLRAEQAAGTVRPDIDVAVVANGVVTIVLSLLMSVTQLGPELAVAHASDVLAVFSAAIDPIDA